MGKITHIRARQPHMTGKAVCLHCKHEWTAVAEIGTVALDCSKCGTGQGVFSGIALPDDPVPLWICDCGCRHFFISPSHAYCCHCGLAQEFE